MKTILVGGGCRSGKSRFAMEMALSLAENPYYIATAQAHDDEMGKRIQKHQDDRSTRFITIEEHLDLVAVMAAMPPAKVVCIDCLTLWISNLLMAQHRESDIISLFEQTLATAKEKNLTSIWVSNEVGLGIMPINALARQFGDISGRCHQILATKAQQVYFTVFGQPLQIKPELKAISTESL